jgi:hypothetical protein
VTNNRFTASGRSSTGTANSHPSVEIVTDCAPPVTWTSKAPGVVPVSITFAVAVGEVGGSTVIARTTTPGPPKPHRNKRKSSAALSSPGENSKIPQPWGSDGGDLDWQLTSAVKSAKSRSPSRSQSPSTGSARADAVAVNDHASRRKRANCTSERMPLPPESSHFACHRGDLRRRCARRTTGPPLREKRHTFHRDTGTEPSSISKRENDWKDVTGRDRPGPRTSFPRMDWTPAARRPCARLRTPGGNITNRGVPRYFSPAVGIPSADRVRYPVDVRWPSNGA